MTKPKYRNIHGTWVEVHPSVTMERLTAMCMRELSSRDLPGVCLACGAEHDPVDQDAMNDQCDVCETRSVYGAQQAMLLNAYHDEEKK